MNFACTIMPHVNMCIFYSLCTKSNPKGLLERDGRHAKKPSAWKITENRIAFKILSAILLP